MLGPLLSGHCCWNDNSDGKNCGFRIADCGFETPQFNPQSEIRNPQCFHGFHVPFATAGTKVSNPAGANSSVRPCSALMYAVIRTFTTCKPSSNVREGFSRPRKTLTKCRSSPS